jgi:hypothetical protein
MPRLEGAIGELLNEVEQDLPDGNIFRQELLISRAIVIDVQLVYGGAKFNVALAGNALKVVASIKPFRRGNPQVLRRVAMALDTPRMPEALSDLRQCLDPEGTPERAEFLLGSLRRRLAQAYLREAREMEAVSWLESLDMVSRASSFIIGAIFGLLGGTTKPEINVPFVVAGGAAVIAGLISWSVLRMRFRRTLDAFCYALLFPTVVAGIVATSPQKFNDATGDTIRGVILAIVIIADIVLFKKFGNRILTSHHADPLGSDPDAVVSGIQAYLAQDWEWLSPHYMDLGPMSNFVRASEAPAENPGGS